MQQHQTTTSTSQVSWGEGILLQSNISGYCFIPLETECWGATREQHFTHHCIQTGLLEFAVYLAKSPSSEHVAGLISIIKWKSQILHQINNLA